MRHPLIDTHRTLELVVVTTSSDFATGSAENPEHDSYDQQNHSQAPQDRNPEQEPQKKKYYAKSDHDYLLSRRR
jgi:hypothetical protein